MSHKQKGQIQCVTVYLGEGFDTCPVNPEELASITA